MDSRLISAASASLLLWMTLPARGQERLPARLVVDPRTTFQTIDGFGVNVIGPYYRDEQKPMFDMFIDDLGAAMFRVGPYFVYSNWEETNDNDDPGVMNWEYYNNRYSSPIFEPSWALMQYLNSRGIRPLIALYGPVPDWMADEKAGPPVTRCARRVTKMPAKTT